MKKVWAAIKGKRLCARETLMKYIGFRRVDPGWVVACTHEAKGYSRIHAGWCTFVGVFCPVYGATCTPQPTLIVTQENVSNGKTSPCSQSLSYTHVG